MKIIIDLDHTITSSGSSRDYPNLEANQDIVHRLREYRSRGFEIVIFTSRNMRTFSGSIGKINVHTLPGILNWLDKNEIPYDEIIVGKPWCENGGFYVDDKSIRPDEFVNLTLDEIYEKIGTEAPQ